MKRLETNNLGAGRPTRRRGFTLIELLVVISIIAILIAILLPTLETAKRQVKVTQCSANLKSFALGLTVYATESQNGNYPANANDGPWAQPLTIWSSVGLIGRTFPDGDAYLSMFKDVIIGKWEAVWCPLYVYGYNRWLYGDAGFAAADPEFPYLWYDNRFGQNYMGGYHKWAAYEGGDFTNSGNEDTTRPPMGPGSAQDAILCDQINSYLGGGGQEMQDSHSPHEMFFLGYAGSEAVKARRENNVAYSDGHVETHGGSAFIDGSGYIMFSGAHWVTRGAERQLY